MRKTLLPVAVLTAALAVPTAAQAANSYTITASLSPSKSGTTKRPVPVGGTFGFKVVDTEGKRPYALDALKLSFTGLRMNTRQFKTCSATSMERASSDKGCPKAALVAQGFANNIAGDINNRDDKSINCYLSLRLWNSGSGKAALFVSGKPNPNNPNDPKQCPIEVNTAIPVSIVRRPTGDRLQFTIPENLKRPLATIRNSLVETKLTLLKKTVRKAGRKVGFWETVGGCRKGRRTITAQFDNEGNNDTTQSGFARCRS